MPSHIATYRVCEGALYLADAREDDWWNKIDLARLKMWDPEDCILGQLYGVYATGLARLELSFEAARDFGFHIVSPDGKDPDVTYEELRDAWVGVIEPLQRFNPAA